MSERRVVIALLALAVLALPSAAAAAPSAADKGPSAVPLLAELGLAAIVVLAKVAHTWLRRRAATPRRSADRAVAAARPRAARAR